MQSILKGRCRDIVALSRVPLFAEATIPDYITSFQSYQGKLIDKLNPGGTLNNGHCGDDDDEMTA